MSEFDNSQCPQCGGTRLMTEHETQVLTYGVYPDSVMVIFAMPVRRCLNTQCLLIFSDEASEKAQTEALTKYRTVLGVGDHEIAVVLAAYMSWANEHRAGCRHYETNQCKCGLSALQNLVQHPSPLSKRIALLVKQAKAAGKPGE